ncbi:monocarboxylate transporter 10-like [Nematostella vectensis]|uniref:monocarboxylate transporter 10-like n=1 Tax=Nematostella vectensis TaxID=45351 RepID=UPI0020774D74|nr:monocarboxylate transporter 10-like [Nematostella vectensis]
MNVAIIQMFQSVKQPNSRWSWLVCFASFCVHFLGGGVKNSFGTMFLALLREFKRSELETAWVGSFAIGMTYFCGPVSAALCERFGCRIIACVGCLLFMTASLITSYMSSIIPMYFTFGFMGGFGFSFMYFSSLFVLMQYFTDKLSLANGVVLAGSGCGSMAFSLLLGKMCSLYGVHAGFKTMAVAGVIGVLASSVYHPTVSDDEGELLVEGIDKDHERIPFRLRCYDAVKPGLHWQNKAFLLWTVSLGLVFFAVFIPYLYLVQIAKLRGIPPSQGSLMVGLMCISGTVGKIVFGRLADVRWVNRLYLLQASLVVIAIGAFVFPFLRSYPGLLTYALLHGFIDSGSGVMFGLITRDIVGKEMMAAALGSMYGVVAIPLTAGPPVAGLMYESLGSYNAVYYLAAALTLTGAALMTFIPRLSRAHRARLEKLLLTYDDPSETALIVDDQKLAELLGFNSPGEMMLSKIRARLDSVTESVISRRSSSFVGIFGIVGGDNYRDVSSYNSRLDPDTLSAIDVSVLGTRRSSRQGSMLSRHSSILGRHGSILSRTHSEMGRPGSMISRQSSLRGTPSPEHVPLTTALEPIEEVQADVSAKPADTPMRVSSLPTVTEEESVLT